MNLVDINDAFLLGDDENVAANVTFQPAETYYGYDIDEIVVSVLSDVE